MTRSEAIEAAALDMLRTAESGRVLCVQQDNIDALRAALALPPDPDWQAIARRLGAACDRAWAALATGSRYEARAILYDTLRAPQNRAALDLMPKEPTP